MKSAQEQQQPSSMDSSDSGTTTASSEYAYRPLTTKHRRAGSTGTTGDEEYTTDEDELYGDETDCAAPGLGHHAPHPILKSDLARAATDLFGYATNKRDEEADEPTSLFDEEDAKLTRDSPTKSLSIFNYANHEHHLGSHNNNNNDDDEKKDNDNQSSGNGKNVNNNNNNGLAEQGALARRRSSASADKTAIPNGTTEPLDRRLNHQEKLQLGEIQSRAEDRKSENSDTASRNSSSSNSSRSEVVSSNDESLEQKDCSEESEEKAATASTLQWGRAVAEVKEQAIAKLQEELRRAHEELKLKDEEVARLSRIRQDVEAELEELTASLFQEAHNMVREANQRQATAERLLEESRMKAEVLAAEVAALKTLVLTSTPAQPNPHLHPQIGSGSSSASEEAHHSGIFAKKQHRRSPSHFNLKYGRENSPPDSPQREPRISLPCCSSDSCASGAGCSIASERDFPERDLDRERDREKKRERYLLSQMSSCEREQREKESRELGLEVDPRVHAEFLKWKANPCVDKSEPFVERIFREDIDLCLDFPNSELGAKVRQAVLDGIIFVEAVSDKAKLGFPKKCALLEEPRQCHYRMRMGDQENKWYCISQICRNRIISVCDFLNYLRYVERGLVKSSVHDVYWEITRLRKEMVLARLGLALSTV